MKLLKKKIFNPEGSFVFPPLAWGDYCNLQARLGVQTSISYHPRADKGLVMYIVEIAEDAKYEELHQAWEQLIAITDAVDKIFARGITIYEGLEDAFDKK